MNFLPTIEEDDESATLLQKLEGGDWEEMDEPSLHAFRLRKPPEELERLSSSIPRHSMRSSSTMQRRKDSSSTMGYTNRRTPSPHMSSRRMSTSTTGTSHREASSALSSPFPGAPHDSGPVVRRGDGQMKKTTSSKRTGGKAPRRGSQRQRQSQSISGHDELPVPQWVINLMLDIEEATRHELTVE